MSDFIQEATDTLTELKRMHQLNFELIEQLNIACQWIVDNDIKIPNDDALRSLVGRSLALIAELHGETPKILQYKTHLMRVNMSPKTDDKLTEPKKATA